MGKFLIFSASMGVLCCLLIVLFDTLGFLGLNRFNYEETLNGRTD